MPIYYIVHLMYERAHGESRAPFCYAGELYY